MFVHLGGDENSTPTYFEVIAADRLVPGLKAAVVYALSVFSQRHPWVHRLLNYDDEVFALITYVLDGHTWLSSDRTFADSLYGLKHKPLRPVASPADRLSRRQRWLILACQVLLPYLRAKADKAYRQSARGSGILALALRYGASQSASAEEPSAAHSSSSSLRDRLSAALVAAYPWLHAAVEGVTFAYHLSYLLGASPVHHPVLHAIGVSMARTSAQDLMAADRDKRAWRRQLLTAWLGPQLSGPQRQAPPASSSSHSAAATALPGTAGLGGGGLAAAAAAGASSSGGGVRRGGAAAAAAAAAAGWLRWAAVRGLLGCRWLLEDHARTALVLAVFGFKALEWWYTTAEDAMSRGKALAPPPPPPPPRPVPPPAGVGLPADPSDCPLCRKRTTNPATIATSGYVFCYPCALGHVMQAGRCPVSLLPATPDHIRKLYDAG